MIGRLFDWLEIELDCEDGLDIGVEGGREVVELESLGEGVELNTGSLPEVIVDGSKELEGNEEVRSESVEVEVMVDNGTEEDGGVELGSSFFICEEVVGSTVLEGTPEGTLVDGGFSSEGLGVLDVDGGS